MIETSSMFEALREVLVGKLKIPADVVTPEATVESIDLDSLAAVELAMMLDKEFSLAITEDELLSAETVGDIVRLMDERNSAA